MKTTKLMVMLGIVALIVLAGCSSNAEKSYAPSGQQYIGGGCGVGAPVEGNSDAAQSIAGASEATAL